jgi:hypothetical protein
MDPGHGSLGPRGSQSLFVSAALYGLIEGIRRFPDGLAREFLSIDLFFTGTLPL